MDAWAYAAGVRLDVIRPGRQTENAFIESFNRFIRTSGTYDAVIDFDKVLRDRAQPTRLRPEYDWGA